MAEKRFSGRVPTKLHAELWSPDGSNILCEVRMLELSPSGCRLKFEKQDNKIPRDPRIKFGLEKAIPLFFETEVIWSKEVKEENFMGLKFKNLPAINKEKIRKYIYDLKYREKYTM